MTKYKVFTCKDFKGLYPVGTAAVIVARDSMHASDLLYAELERLKLKQDKPISLPELNITEPSVLILNNGDY